MKDTYPSSVITDDHFLRVHVWPETSELKTLKIHHIAAPTILETQNSDQQRKLPFVTMALLVISRKIGEIEKAIWSNGKALDGWLYRSWDAGSMAIFVMEIFE